MSIILNSANYQDQFLEACLDPEVQISVIGIEQAKAYCQEYGGAIPSTALSRV